MGHLCNAVGADSHTRPARTRRNRLVGKISMTLSLLPCAQDGDHASMKAPLCRCFVNNHYPIFQKLLFGHRVLMTGDLFSVDAGI